MIVFRIRMNTMFEALLSNWDNLFDPKVTIEELT